MQFLRKALEEDHGEFSIKNTTRVSTTTVEDGSEPQKTTELKLQLSGCKSNPCISDYTKLVK